jgi:hypothetical protein
LVDFYTGKQVAKPSGSIRDLGKARREALPVYAQPYDLKRNPPCPSKCKKN